MKDKKIIIIIIVIVIAGAAYWLLKPAQPPLEPESELPEVPEDEISTLLENLKQETEISFSEIQDVEFKWVVNVDPQIKEETVSGKGFEANVIPSEQFDKIHLFLIDNGFKTDVYNLAAGTISGLTGYLKVKTVCTVSGGLTGYKEAEGQWIPTDTDNWDIIVKCGNVEKTKMEYAVEDWQSYTNEKYGYSLKYPQGCLYGPLPGYCKQSPPEERPQECRCFLNGTDPNSILMQTFTGPKDNLSGASFVVSHYSTDPYNPPAGADLVEWLKEKFPYQEIPDDINEEIDGMQAVKVYTPFSGMAWSQEDIYFIKNGKVFQISMLDVDNKDNRALYNQILSTFRFLEVSEEEQTIETKNNENFSIVLEANPTTGYEWEVDFDSIYLELVERNYVPGSPELIGSGGEETFNFLAKKSGTIEITFSYLRSWESVQPIEKKVYEIIIK